MITRTFLSRAFGLGAIVVSMTASYAAVPYSTIKGWQDSAPDFLEVTVLSVREETRREKPVGPSCTQIIREFTVTAKVDVVHRTGSGVKPGQTITFHDSTLRTGPCAIPGGNFGDMLNGGDRAEAYLRPAGTPDGNFMAVHIEKQR